MPRKPGLELEQDLDFQRGEWHFQRVAWWMLCGFVLAALLGVFGSGPLSHAVASTPELAVEYERFARAGTASTIRVRLPRGSGSAPVLYVNRPYYETLRVQRISPEPQAVAIEPERVVLRFGPEAIAGDAIVLDVELTTWGVERVALQLGDGEPVTFRQLIYF